MRKLISILLIFVFVFSIFIVPIDAEAKTLGDLKKTLATLKNQKAAADSKKKKTQAEINAINAKIKKTGDEIEACEQGILDAQEQITVLGTEIENKETQIKDLMQFYQIANSENFYLNYIFGATDYTDFIYRYAIVEQLTSKNKELVEEMEDLIVENEKRTVELADKQVELDKLTESLQDTAADLGNDLKSFVAESLDADQEIKAMNDLINFYVKQGCKDNEDIAKCVNIPYSAGFNKPLKSGVVTSEYGQRKHPITKVKKLHTGIDLGGNREGIAIYASAAGRVAAIIKRSSCGGNQVYMHHNIGGVYYTTAYLHMLAINVKVGDVVAQGQKIGTVGGGAKTRSYDKCSTGAHLHFTIAKGLYFNNSAYGYTSYSTFVKKLINPRTVLYFPAKGKWW